MYTARVQTTVQYLWPVVGHMDHMVPQSALGSCGLAHNQILSHPYDKPRCECRCTYEE